jgi:hypothetical protein
MRSTSQLRYSSAIGRIVLIAALGAAVTMNPASALNVATPASVGVKADHQAFGDRLQVRAFVRRGGARVGPRGGVAFRGSAAVGPRGGAAYRRTAVVGPRGNVAVRNTAVGRRGGWARPGWYGWPAARSQRVLRSALSAPRLRQPGQARRRHPVCAGTTPTPPARKDSGTTAGNDAARGKHHDVATGNQADRPGAG